MTPAGRPKLCVPHGQDQRDFPCGGEGCVARPMDVLQPRMNAKGPRTSFGFAANRHMNLGGCESYFGRHPRTQGDSSRHDRSPHGLHHRTRRASQVCCRRSLVYSLPMRSYHALRSDSTQTSARPARSRYPIYECNHDQVKPNAYHRVDEKVPLCVDLTNTALTAPNTRRSSGRGCASWY